MIRGERPQTPPSLIEFERPIAEGVLARMAPGASGGGESQPLEVLAQRLVTSTLPPVAVHREVEDGDAVGEGGLVVHIPGHTAGSIAVLVPALGVLFTGDTLASHEGRVIPGVFNVDRAGLLDSIRKLAGLEFEVACFGHGAPVVGDASRPDSRARRALPLTAPTPIGGRLNHPRPARPGDRRRSRPCAS